MPARKDRSTMTAEEAHRRDQKNVSQAEIRPRRACLRRHFNLRGVADRHLTHGVCKTLLFALQQHKSSASLVEDDCKVPEDLPLKCKGTRYNFRLPMCDLPEEVMSALRIPCPEGPASAIEDFHARMTMAFSGWNLLLDKDAFVLRRGVEAPIRDAHIVDLEAPAVSRPDLDAAFPPAALRALAPAPAADTLEAAAILGDDHRQVSLPTSHAPGTAPSVDTTAYQQLLEANCGICTPGAIGIYCPRHFTELVMGFIGPDT